MVVGEVSGENLGLALLDSLNARFHTNPAGDYDALNVRGILGEKLVARGGQAIAPMERLSVVGIIEPLFRIPELYRIRRYLIQNFIQNPPDVFIGIDAPDFNLGLEKILRKQGIPTVHYVSPTVWAWRQGRIHKIKKAVDLMLTLFPFEAKFYEAHGVPVCFTGHPLADQIPLLNDAELKTKSLEARKILGIDLNKPTMALLPGSRDKEIATLSEIYLETAKWCYEREKQLQFLVALVKESHKQQFIEMKNRIAPELPMTVLAQNSKGYNNQADSKEKTEQGPDQGPEQGPEQLEKQTEKPITENINTTRLALQASDVVLVKAGTATLEVMLHKKPMVVSYRVHPLSYEIFKRLIKVPWVALPNLLAEEQLVPEFLQEDMQPELMGRALLTLLDENNTNLPLHGHKSGEKWLGLSQEKTVRSARFINRTAMIERFFELHQVLRRGASDRAAQAIESLVIGTGSQQV